jgi:hypothetical protein
MSTKICIPYLLSVFGFQAAVFFGPVGLFKEGFVALYHLPPSFSTAGSGETK